MRLSGPLGWMIRHHVVANLLMMALIVGGIVALPFIKQEVFPDYERDEVVVTFVYPQASPQEIERAILEPVEKALEGVEGIYRIKSIATIGQGSIYVEALRGYDLFVLQNDIQSAVARVRTIPKNAEKPLIRRRSYERSTVSLILYGKTDRLRLYHYAKLLRSQLLYHPQISQVNFYGVSDLILAIEADPLKVRRYNLTYRQIVERMMAEAVDVSGGVVRRVGGEILLRVDERSDIAKLYEIPLKSFPDGRVITLKDVATIAFRFEDEDYFALYNGDPAIRIEVKNPARYSPIEIAKVVEQTLREFRSSLPEGIEVEVLRSGAKVFEDRVWLLVKNALAGLVLVLVVLSLFLRPRLAFWVMMGIPVSFLGALLLFYLFGVSINMISLFAFIIALGIVVDDAIVVGENVYTYQQRGYAPPLAAYLGVKEMAVPVSFSILTNIVAFMPIFFIPGVTGKIFEAIPLVVSLIFAISWFESLFLLPAHLAAAKSDEPSKWQRRFLRSFEKFVRFGFGAVIQWALANRLVVVALFSALLVLVASYALSGRMGMRLFPDTEGDYVRALVRYPVGTGVQKTQEGVRQLIEAAREVAKNIERGEELVRGIYAVTGRSGPHSAEVRVYLADPDIRKEIMSAMEFGRRWREATPKIDGAAALLFFSRASVGAHGAPIVIDISHFDTNLLAKIAKEVQEALRRYPGVFNIDTSLQRSKQELLITPSPLAKALGVSASELAQIVRTRYYGGEVYRTIVRGDEVKVLVRMPQKERRRLDELFEGYVRLKSGKEVQLSKLMKIQISSTPTQILRKNGKRVVSVEADIRPRSEALKVINDLKEHLFNQLRKRYPGVSFSFEGRQAEIRANIATLKWGFVLAVALIYLLLAIVFNSYKEPLVVMLAIPYGIIGAIIGHMVMGYSLSIISLFGIVALCGVVVNDALIMVSFANEYKKRFGFSVVKVAKESALRRFRPVFLTTVTTFSGLLPMLFETSRQAKFLIPMAISIGFGILFATFITLLLVPVLYTLFVKE